MVFATHLAQAAAGAPDTSFGNGGKVQTNFTKIATNGAVAKAALIQQDGKIVIAVIFIATQAATESAGLVRYLSNGSLDVSYGQRGAAMVSFTNFINVPNSVAIQGDGKIIIAGEAQTADGDTSEFALARLNTNGSLDSTFGNGGKVTTNFVGVQAGGVSNPANAVVLQPDGKILAAGLASECAKCSHDTALARYNTNGALDTTFGTGGKVRVTLNAGPPDALGVLTNCHILTLSGTSIFEFDSSGVLQSTVTGGTIAAASTGGTNVFQPDGRFIATVPAAGDNRHDSDMRVERFQPSGSADSTFNSPVFELGSAAAFEPNGQILLGAQPDAEQPGAGFFVSRMNIDGSLDTSFGDGGAVNTQFPNTSALVAAIVVQTDGKIVAVGTALENGGGPADIALARYLGQ